MKFNSIWILVLLLTLVGCGKMRGVDGTPFEAPNKITPSKLPYKYYVKRADYEKNKSRFENVENDIDDTAGKNAIDFIVVDELPEYTGAGEFTVEVVDITDVYDSDSNCGQSTTAGCFSGWTSTVSTGDGSFTQHKSGEIHIDSGHNRTGGSFENTLLHEVGHSLGFHHIQDEISFMNPTMVGPTGFQNHDEDRVAALFEIVRFLKDLERMGANREHEELSLLQESLENQFGLSEGRSEEVARVIHSFNRIRNKRSLNVRENNILTQRLLGTSFSDGKKALESHIQGDSSSYEEIIERASELNGTSPEHISELASEYLF